MRRTQRWEGTLALIWVLGSAALTLLAITGLFFVSLFSLATGDVISFSTMLALGLALGVTLLVFGLGAWQLIRWLNGQVSSDEQVQVKIPSGVLWTVGTAWFPLVALGIVFSSHGRFTPLVGLLSLPVIFVPVLLSLSLAVHHLKLGSPVRFWGTMAVSLTAGPFFSMVFEGLLALLFLVGIGVWARHHPDVFGPIVDALSALDTGGTQTPEMLDAVTEAVGVLFTQPMLLTSGLLYMAVFVPLIEELFKPLVVWALGPRLSSPAEGFALGAVSGAAFAWYENVLSGSMIGSDWGVIVLVRALTPVVHILASGLVGWGIALLWREGNWMAFAQRFGVAWALHAVWNAVAVLVIPVELGVWPTERAWLLNGVWGVVYLLGVGALYRLNLRWRMNAV